MDCLSQRLSPIIPLLAGVVLNILLLSLPILNLKVYHTQFWSNPSTIIFYLQIASFTCLEGYASSMTGGQPASFAEKPLLPYLTGCSILLVFWLSLYDHASQPDYHFVQAAFAVMLFTSGLLLRLISILTLRRYFVSHIQLQKDHRLLTTGIFSFIRHPSEVGLLLICCSIVVLFFSYIGMLALALLVLPLTLYRLRQEDELLSRAFGAEFFKYKNRTPALVPLVSIWLRTKRQFLVRRHRLPD